MSLAIIRRSDRLEPTDSEPRSRARSSIVMVLTGVVIALLAMVVIVMAGSATGTDGQQSVGTTGGSNASAASTAVTVGGGGCPAGSTVTIEAAGRVIGATTADAAGGFSTSAAVPTSAHTSTQEVTIVCGSTLMAMSVGGLPGVATSGPWPEVAIGSGLVALASALVIVLRHRARLAAEQSAPELWPA